MLEQPHLRMEVIWADEQMIELQVYASNQRHRGTIEIYTIGESLMKFADSLEGFPKDSNETVVYDEGKRDSYAFLSLTFYCVGSLGHAAVQVCMEEDASSQSAEGKAKTQFALNCEPAAIERFRNQLTRMAHTESGSATLECV
jgi:hypothetical protein